MQDKSQETNTVLGKFTRNTPHSLVSPKPWLSCASCYTAINTFTSSPHPLSFSSLPVPRLDSIAEDQTLPLPDMALHPFDQLTIQESEQARDIVLKLHSDRTIFFRYIYLEEPPKAQIKAYLEAEHNGKTPDPLDRKALVQYDVIGSDRVPAYNESVVNLTTGKRVVHDVVGKEFHPSLAVPEFGSLLEACEKSELFKKCLKEYQLPEGHELVIEPWPYGGLLPGEENKRYFQGLCFAQDTRSGNADSNFYSFPLPFIPIMDCSSGEIIRVDRLATGGTGDPMEPVSVPERPVDHCKASEYVPELLPNGPRTDLKPLNVLSTLR